MQGIRLALHAIAPPEAREETLVKLTFTFVEDPALEQKRLGSML